MEVRVHRAEDDHGNISMNSEFRNCPTIDLKFNMRSWDWLFSKAILIPIKEIGGGVRTNHWHK